MVYLKQIKFHMFTHAHKNNILYTLLCFNLILLNYRPYYATLLHSNYSTNSQNIILAVEM